MGEVGQAFWGPQKLLPHRLRAPRDPCGTSQRTSRGPCGGCGPTAGPPEGVGHPPQRSGRPPQGRERGCRGLTTPRAPPAGPTGALMRATGWRQHTPPWAHGAPRRPYRACRRLRMTTWGLDRAHRSPHSPPELDHQAPGAASAASGTAITVIERHRNPSAGTRQAASGGWGTVRGASAATGAVVGAEMHITEGNQPSPRDPVRRGSPGSRLGQGGGGPVGSGGGGTGGGAYRARRDRSGTPSTSPRARNGRPGTPEGHVDPPQGVPGAP